MVIIEFVLFLIGSILVFISFLVGKGKQEEINLKVDKFWGNFTSKNEKGIIKSIADLSISGIDKLYGKNVFLRSILISLTVFFILLFLFVGGFEGIDKLNAQDNNDGEIWMIFFMFIAPINAIIDYISVRVTRYFLNHIRSSKSFISILRFFVLEIFIGFIFYFIPVNFEVLIEILLDDPNGGLINSTKELFSLLVKFFNTGVDSSMESFLLAVSFSGFLPSIIFLITIIATNVLLLLYLILPKSVGFVLNRLRESNSSYLAVLGGLLIIFSNFIAKITKLF